MGVVYGAPIPCERIAEPTPADVDALHGRYVVAVRGLFDKYKAEFGYAAGEELVIA